MYLFCALCGEDLREEGVRQKCTGCGFVQFPLDTKIPISAKDSEADIKKGAFLLDVREPYEYNITHIEGSKLIPLRELASKINDIPKDKEIIVYCHHGYRSFFAAQFLMQNGFDARSMTGGIEAWSLEVEPIRRY